MPKKILYSLLLSLFIPCLSIAQGSDMILLKKKNGKTAATYFKGSYITFTDAHHTVTSGVIHKIDKDSLYIQFFDVRRKYNMWYTSVADTITSWLNRYHYREIQSIAKESASFEFIRNGTLFMVGGTGYAILHLINAAIQQEQVSGKALAIAGSVALTGYVMHKLRKKKYVIGKTYSLAYIDMN
jgi:hypothetical protein